MHKVCLILLLAFNSYSGATQEVIDCKLRKNQTLNGSGYEGVSRADNSRSDSINILHTTISLDITDIPGAVISGWTELEVKAQKNNITSIGLDLLKLTVDSVWVNNSPSSFQYNDTLITLNLPSVMNSGDEVLIRVFYQGDPEQDVQWGGFYFTGNYAFNLGVGFAANPHNYGRVWFPCFDNFVERSTYSFYIKTLNTDKAFCNGSLIDTTHTDTTIIWHYELMQTIPSYLVAVAVSNYETVSFTYDGIPIRYAALAGDTANMKLSFVNIGGAIDAFQKGYGPHGFDLVGFNLVPFGGGAMEHATAIAYPRSVVTGGATTFEYLMAHEFAHHWWGDMITCRTQEDMWLNEGWASYSEYLFYEEVYGRQRYKDEVRSNHEEVLRRAHIDDNGFRAVSGVPHAYTYGTTVYDKGAEVAHTLRGYLGDSTFFECITSFLNAFAFDDVSSEDFRDHLTDCSGIDMTAFFDNWVFSPGFPHFSIDSVLSTSTGGEFDISVFVRQKLRKAPALYSNIPLEVTFFDDQWNKQTKTILMDGECGEFKTTLDFEPVLTVLDLEERISDAVTNETRVISTTGVTNFPFAKIFLDVQNISDSSYIRIENNWVLADPLKEDIAGLHVSQDRYWTIDGIKGGTFISDATVNYNRPTSGAGALDPTIFDGQGEDSLVVLYRQYVSDDWSIWDSIQINTGGNVNDGVGNIIIYNIEFGQYAFGIWDHRRPDTTYYSLPSNCTELNHVGIQEDDLYDESVVIIPNPAYDQLKIQFSVDWNTPVIMELFNIVGQKSASYLIKEATSWIDISSLKGGVYLLRFTDETGGDHSVKLIIL